METTTARLVKFIDNNGGTARFTTIIKAGFHPDALKALEKNGRISKIGKGLYRLSNHVQEQYPDFVDAALQAPKGVICLITALSYYEVTDEIPRRIDLAIPQGTRANIIKYPPVKFYRFSPMAWNAGIEDVKAGENTIKIYNLAKTIADCFKFRNRIGVDVARNAMKIAVTEKGIKPLEIMKYAKICRVDNIIKPILEAII